MCFLTFFQHLWYSHYLDLCKFLRLWIFKNTLLISSNLRMYYHWMRSWYLDNLKHWCNILLIKDLKTTRWVWCHHELLLVVDDSTIRLLERYSLNVNGLLLNNLFIFLATANPNILFTNKFHNSIDFLFSNATTKNDYQDNNNCYTSNRKNYNETDNCAYTITIVTPIVIIVIVGIVRRLSIWFVSQVIRIKINRIIGEVALGCRIISVVPSCRGDNYFCVRVGAILNFIVVIVIVTV